MYSRQIRLNSQTVCILYTYNYWILKHLTPLLTKYNNNMISFKINNAPLK